MTVDERMHIVPVPSWTFHVRLAQFVLAFVLLIFIAVPTSIWGGFAAFGLGLFTCIATFIIVAYSHLTTTRFLHFYNRWAILALDTFGVVFWLISFALLASWSADAFSGSYIGEIFPGYVYDPYTHGIPYQVDKRGLANRDNLHGNYAASRGLAAAAAAGGAVEFVLFILTLGYFSLSLHRHRLEGFHSTYGTPQTARDTQEMNATNGSTGAAVPTNGSMGTTTTV